MMVFPLMVLMTAIHPGAQAQYFGRNKPKYEGFNFKVVQTPNYEVYHYLEN